MRFLFHAKKAKSRVWQTRDSGSSIEVYLSNLSPVKSEIAHGTFFDSGGIEPFDVKAKFLIYVDLT